MASTVIDEIQAAMEAAGVAGAPHSLEAEQAVLGAVMLDAKAMDSVGDVLREVDFYLAPHRTIWGVIAARLTAGKAGDLLTVADDLGRRGELDDVGGLRYLNALVDGCPAVRSARAYAEIVRERSLERRLAAAGREIAAEAGQPGRDMPAKLDAAMKRITTLAEQGATRESVHIEDACVAYMDMLQAESEGESLAVSTGLRHLDRMLAGGPRPGELIVIGARPKMGKTALVLTLARNMAQRAGVLFLSQEMPVTELVARNTAALGQVNLADLRRGRAITDDTWGRVAEAMDRIRGLQLLLDEQRALTLMDVRRKVMEAKRRMPALKVVVIDFLQLMSGEGDNRNQELDRISNGLKAMAGEFGVCVLLLSQLSREADKRAGPPIQTDLRDSGAIEAAADVIALLYREEAHPLGDHGPQFKGWCNLEIIQRNGAPGHISLHFSGEYQRFSDWDGPVPEKSFGSKGRGSAMRAGGLD